MRDFFSSLVERFQEADRQQRLYVLLAVVVAIVGLRYGVSWLFEYRDQVKADIRLSAQRLAGARKLVEREGEAQEHLSRVRARYGKELRRLVPGDTPMLAAAGLQDRVSTAASNNGVRIQSTQVLKDEPVGPFRRVSLRVTASGAIRELAGMMAGLEFGDPSVRIPFVELSRRGAVRVRGKKKTGRTVSATFQVTAIMAAGEEMGAIAGASSADSAAGAGGEQEIALAASAPGDQGDIAVGKDAETAAPIPNEEGTAPAVEEGSQAPGASADPAGSAVSAAVEAADAGAATAAVPPRERKTWKGIRDYRPLETGARKDGGKQGRFGGAEWKAGLKAPWGRPDVPVAPEPGDG